MDELDIRIIRAIITGNSSASFSNHLRASLREVARNLKVDDVTLRNRFKRLQEKGALSGWKVFPNPNMFGYRMTNVLVDTPPKSPKDDMMRKLKLVHGVVAMLDYYGDSLGTILLYDSDQSLSRTIELISRITNAENIIQTRVV